MKEMRKMIEIDESKCDGCGLCIVGCHENALAIVDGKAKVVKESYCDGLGDCVGECPRGALRVVEKECDPFIKNPALEAASESPKAPVFGGCPGMAARMIQRQKPATEATPVAEGEVAPQLAQWPIQLHLVPVEAPYWKDADLLVAADCAPVAYGDFQNRFLRNKRLVIACPKLDDKSGYLEKLTEIIRRNNIRSVTALRMEVPCCAGITALAKQAVDAAGTDAKLDVVTIGINGEILDA